MARKYKKERILNNSIVITMKESKSYRDFLRASEEINKYLRLFTNIPSEVSQEYERSLGEYRQFLDSHGLSMPQHKFPYKRDDIKTHKFLDYTTSGVGRHTSKIHMNPKYKYSQESA